MPGSFCISELSTAENPGSAAMLCQAPSSLWMPKSSTVNICQPKGGRCWTWICLYVQTRVLFSSTNEVNNNHITLSWRGELWQLPVLPRNYFSMLGRGDFSPTYPPGQAETWARIVLPYMFLAPHLGAGPCSVGRRISVGCQDPSIPSWHILHCQRQFVSPLVCPGWINGV